jgi:probable lipoprotein (TIGR04455 family)
VRVMVAKLKSQGGDLSVDMTADLQRCDSGALVWKVEIDDTNEQKNADLKELANVYRREFGAVADALAAPFFVVLKQAFDSLPSPVLTDEETMEKIELE